MDKQVEKEEKCAEESAGEENAQVNENEPTPRKKKGRTLLELFFTYFKIGLFTFGGGYAMIALLEREFVERKKWIGRDEFTDVIAIAESTPGPVAINCATYIGYKVGKFSGALVATLAVCIPSFAIIFAISLFFDAFLKFKYVAYAFRGIQACVVFLILSAGIKMFRGLKKTPLGMVLFVAAFGLLIAFSLLAVNFSSVFFILIGGVVGLIAYGIGIIRARKTEKANDSAAQGKQEEADTNGEEAQ
ncbi:MAG: chromate transporter [Clostridiales bacterium]|nr:chromate transporter [Clostridiales bacterium]